MTGPQSPAIVRAGMRLIKGGIFTMGSEAWYPEESPTIRVKIDPFWIDETPVTNRQFAEFVSATGHVTVAEKLPNPADYPGMLPEMIFAGSLVFTKPSGPVEPVDFTQWWTFLAGANWRHPQGPGRDIDDLDLWDHPVVHVAWSDAKAYALWIGKELPTEAQHEFAARGGQDGQDFAWGQELAPDGRMMANYWQGTFPFANTCQDGWEGTSPVGSFPPNPLGLFDMIGNVWEWTQDWWEDRASGRSRKPSGPSCCTPKAPRGGTFKTSLDPAFPEGKIGRKVVKGGSHLCAPNYCERYRPAARQPEAVDSSTTHIGFRCVRNRV